LLWETGVFYGVVCRNCASEGKWREKVLINQWAGLDSNQGPRDYEAEGFISRQRTAAESRNTS
jgi:hypothetical protein